MALVIADRVRETTTTTGTGAVTLAGAYTSFQSFLAAVGNGNSTYYTIASAVTGEWEVGIGTYTSASNTLSRTTVLASSNAGSLVNFSSGAKDVFVTQPAERSILVQSAGSGLFSGVAAFTANGVPYANSTSTLTTGSALTFDGTNLGIGTSSPGYKLDIAGASGVAINIANTGDSNRGGRIVVAGSSASGTVALNTTSSGYGITFGIDSTEKMRLDTSGNLGIGTSSPISRLHVNTSSATATYATVGNTNNGVQIGVTAAGTPVIQNYAGVGMSFGGNGNSTPTTQMTLDSSGNLGIGTSSPSAKLTVTDTNGIALRLGDISAAPVNQTAVYVGPATTALSGAINGDLVLIPRTSTTASITFWTGSTTAAERMRLDYSGNLGLGVTPSSSWSAVNGPALQIGAFASVFNNSSLGSSEVAYNTIRSGSDAYVYNITGIAASRFQQRDGTFRFFTAASGTAGNAITFTQAMTLDASGNLGLGIAAPNLNDWTSGALGMHIKGASNYGVLKLESNDSKIAWLATGSSATYLFVKDANPLIFGTNNTERARIDSSGTLMIATTTNRGGKFNVNGSSYFAGDIYMDTATAMVSSGSGAWPLIFGINGTERARIDSSGNFLVGTTSNSTNIGNGFKVNVDISGTGHTDPAIVTPQNNASYSCWDIYSTNTSSYRFYVTTTGVVNAVSTTITAISDQRLKENIRDLDDGLATVMALKPRKFDWKEGKGAGIKNARGFIAQEFEQVLPDLIDEWKDPAPEGEEPYKAVRADLIPTLVKAIQEQQAQIESLRKRLADAGIA